jgi:hypothetical protein
MAVNWQVVNQVPRDELLTTGSFESGWEVYYRTVPEGINGSVWVPKRLYNEETVRGMIDAEVSQLKAIANL